MLKNYDKIHLNTKKIGRTALLIFLGIILVLSVYGSLRRTAARFSKDFMIPFHRAINLTEESAFRLVQMTKPKRKLAAENRILLNQTMRMKAEIISLKKLEEENRTLRAILKLPPKQGFTPLTAEICGRTAPLWRERFVINKGWSDGVQKGDAVTAPDRFGNLVMAGQVIEVSAGTAVVATVYSEDCKLSVSMETDGSAGGMELPPSSRNPVVRYLPLDGDYRNHARVLTSGISESTPQGIPVAEILPRGKNSSPAVIKDQLYAELNVKPLIRIDSLRFTVVFTRNSRSSKK